MKTTTLVSCFSALVALMLTLGTAALDLDVNSPDSIRKASKAIAEQLMKQYYHGEEPGRIPGMLPGPPPAPPGETFYYWWQGGALWGTMLDYWHYTGDAQFNGVIERALLFQRGEHADPPNAYLPGNWSLQMGNDDQGFWGLSAMLAAESVFQDPPAGMPGWLALAQAVWNSQALGNGIDNVCGGGLRWQVFPTSKGWDYKNAIANGIFFNLGARIMRYTGNQTYSERIRPIWDWMYKIGLISEEGNVYDGGHDYADCKDINKAQFTYNQAIVTQGAAFMFNQTNGASPWRENVDSLINRTLAVSFPNGTAVETPCELEDKIICLTDQESFKGYLHRWMAVTAHLVPHQHDAIMKVLRSSAAAAAKSCTGTPLVCGFRWTTGKYDGQTGAGEMMNALGAISSLLIDEVNKPPATGKDGGTSTGDPNAGERKSPLPGDFEPLPLKDRAGAGVLTAVVLIAMVALQAWMMSGVSEQEPSKPAVKVRRKLSKGKKPEVVN